MLSKRILSYLESPEWARQLAALVPCGVDYQVFAGHAIWPWEKEEMPESARFVAEPTLSNYAALVLPPPSDSAAYKHFSRSFAAIAGQTKIPLIETTKDDPGLSIRQQLENPKRPELVVLPVRLKLRWGLTAHPAWMRHAHLISHIIIGDDKKEPTEGTLLVLGCGDGAMLGFLMHRFGALDCSGICFNEDELIAAKRVNAAIPISYDSGDGKVRDTTYIVAEDAGREDLDAFRQEIEAHAKKIGVITIQKTEEDVCTIFELYDSFPGWKVLETPSHFALVYRAN